VTYTTHGIHGGFAQFMLKIVSFDKTNSMFSCYRAIHLHGPLHHSVDDTLSDLPFTVTEQNNR